MGNTKTAHPKISLEDYIYYYHIAYKRDNISALSQLSSMYPDLSVQAFQNAANPDKGTQADYNSDCLHPVATGNSRMTERRILDMVAYLFCRENAPKEFRVQLHRAALPAKEVFNHYLDRYQKDYDRDELWENFFLRLPELRQIIRRRRIGSLMELEYRAAEYFERYSCGIKDL